MFFVLFNLVTSFSTEKPYSPDIKIGCFNRSQDKCKRIVTETSIVYCHVLARVEGQLHPIIDTRAAGNQLRIKMDSQKVIPGFTKGLLQACLGETRRITIPPGLAYGEQGVDGLFDPDSTWIVDVEILDIVENKLV
ncbi:peptidyl-prolyl cis-trans isomerase, FKBP-type family protein [Trichomonas vaginalis G3]|uniref:peptidylprolyl isomerase n=1 Tax=Trichomonas vaginalis (strain ATCC PRA-98 / G3) TaxID=412133 RepID=A2DYS7_TRIV3|nr:peptidyl-prolyl cis-trans isomerase protein [Trichomonas vaginalis G3]EAY14467.1 peptidyl-prolyl cis-trans isomerase, FKBP-type family protein [Trichomonas vaginalis G3]KAI5519647.1 peptidyl-prolyl cis-trans isomerase protein [Trichomonas vaginalis G3]|eukprot:XP_001326690.1 peptidyl-prolyl cis-trans isomerase, FKBP-type family protein [Trichomonas vaginalis G3]